MPKRSRGFTLLELMVALAIIMIIAVLILVNYRQGQKNYILTQAAQALVGNLREAQNMAFTSAEVSGQPNIGGFGIRILSDSSYQLFLNTSSDADGCPTGTRTDLGNIISLPSGISINNTNTNVFYAPPDPKTCISTGNPSITYTLTNTSTGKSTTVIVNKYGVIDVQ